ncbi:type VI secretion system-associated FHA domain protein TagH, partial [Mesorhizobium sp. M7A.T.Ca.US.000.02.2.1]
LRLGDYVVYVDLQTPTAQAPTAGLPAPERLPPASRAPVSIGHDDFFSATVEEEPRRPRPADLPDPFERPVPGAFERATSGQRSSPGFDDPFSLDPVSTPVSKNAASYREPGGAGNQADPFGPDPVPSPSRGAEPAHGKPSDFKDDFGFGSAAAPGSANGTGSAGQRER